MKSFADTSAAKVMIKKLYPQATEVVFIDHGYDNLVFLVDKKFAIKFPKNEFAFLRNQLEKQILSELLSYNELEIPKIVAEGKNHPYIVTTFVHGQHLTPLEINKFPISKQQQLGERVSRFAHVIHSTISAVKVKDIRRKLGLAQKEEPWPVYFEKYLLLNTLPTKQQDKLAKSYFEKLSVIKYSTPMVAVHDDLHTENMLFNNHQLTGIVDFGDTYVGVPEQEFRQLFRINETVLDSAIKSYEKLSGFKLNKEAIKIWAIIQEIAIYSEMKVNKKTDHPTFARTIKNLNKWLPEGKWGKNTSTTSRQ